MRRVARLTAALALTLGPTAAAAAAPGAAAGTTSGPVTATKGHLIPLPPAFRNIDPLNDPAVKLRKDRLRTSKVPGTVDDTEALTVGLDPVGAPVAVTDRQRLVIHGTGPYLVYELGPARAVRGLNDLSLPTAELGQVVWQGFSPGTRTLDGLLTLDAGIEASRLPLRVSLQFTGADGRPGSLQPGARAPSDGTVTVTLTNQTASPRFISVGTADLTPLARTLDALLRAARSGRGGVPPYAGAGLPTAIPGALAGQTTATVSAPLRVRGTIRVRGATDSPVTGAGSTPVVGGATVSGTLNGSAPFEVHLRRGQALRLDLDVQPWLDPRTLGPPGGLPTWTAWAASGPDTSSRSDATGRLIDAAAQAARAGDYSPYLQTDTEGMDVATFHYEMAPDAATRRTGEGLSAKPGAIVAACLAGLAIAGNAALLRRRW